MWASEAASLASSLRLCAVELRTTPVAAMVCPTCSPSDTLSLRTSQVLPSLAVSRYSLEFPASCSLLKQPVMVRVSDFDFVSLFDCANVHTDPSTISIKPKNKELGFSLISLSPFESNQRSIAPCLG